MNEHESIFGRPEADMIERESVEKFEAEVAPAYQQFLEELAQRTNNPVVLVDRSHYSPIAHEVGVLWLPTIRIYDAIPCDLLLTIGNDYFPPLGFTNLYRDPDEVGCSLEWSNPVHGGNINIASNKNLYAFGESGRRPTEHPGREQGDYTRSEWELNLPWDPNSPFKPHPRK